MVGADGTSPERFWLCPLVFFVRLLASFAAGQVREYCIVGAGPSGIQLGHLLKHAGRDYVIFERARKAGSFFKKFPRHRQLISLNKRVMREGRSADFAMRHDWNSLLDVRDEASRTHPMTNRTEAFFPHADVLAEYLAEFAQEQRDAIEYGVVVHRIRRAATAGDGDFELVVRPGNGGKEAEEKVVRCRAVVVATGLQRVRSGESTVDGVEHVRGYESLPAAGKNFEGQSVIILGLGNAALETAQALQPYTSDLHVLGRRRELPGGGRGVRIAHQTHYVGDIRAGRTTVLDTYLLKSLDTFGPDELEAHRLLVMPRADGRLQVFQVNEGNCLDDACEEGHQRGAQGVNYAVKVTSWVKGSSTRSHVQQIFAKHGLADVGDETQAGHPASWMVVPKKLESDNASCRRKIADTGILKATASSGLLPRFEREEQREKFLKYMAKHRIADFLQNAMDRLAEDMPNNPYSVLSDFSEEFFQLSQQELHRKTLHIVDEVFQADFEELIVNSSVLRKSPQLLQELGRLHETYEFGTRYPVDHVIRCFGWFMDLSVFDASLPVSTTHHGKYPDIDAGYEAKQVPGLYFAGALTHGLDFRKSSGGFIHGFRYTARALFRLLEERHFGVPWPHESVPLCPQRTDGDKQGESGAEVGVDALARRMHRRINEAAGPYQMYDALGDMVVFEAPFSADSCWTARYLEEVPLAMFHERYHAVPRLTWVFKYSDHFHGPMVLKRLRVPTRNPVDAHLTNFLHPHVSFYGAGSRRPKMDHVILDDVFTQWQSAEFYSPLVRFVAHATSSALGAKELLRPGVVNEDLQSAVLG